MGRASGLTLIETLVAAALLLLVMSMIIVALVMGFDRSHKLESKQENLQEFIIFRERLHLAVRNAMIELSASDATNLSFILPARRPTAFGHLDTVSLSESTRWDTGTTYTVSFTQVGSDHVFLQRQSGPSGSSETVWWNMGKLPAGAHFELSRMPTLTVQVQGRERLDQPPWTRTITTVVKTYRD